MVLLHTDFTHHYSTMGLLQSAWFYITMLWLYFTLLESTVLSIWSTSLYFTLQYSTMALLPSTWFYNILPWLYFTPFDSTWLSIGSTSFYFTAHNSTIALLHSIWLFITVPCLYFTLATLLYIIQPWIYFPPLDSIWHSIGSTSFYFTAHNSDIALHHLTPHYCTIPLLHST